MAAPPRERQCGREALTKGVRVAAIGSADAMKVREVSLDIRTTILRPAR